MLETTKVVFQLVLDPDMYVFIEKGTRSGVRYSKVSNKYLKPYNPKPELKNIIYLDAKGLYGYADV